MKHFVITVLLLVPFSIAGLHAQDAARNMALEQSYSTVRVQVKWGPSVCSENCQSDGWGFIVGKKKNVLFIVTPNHVLRGKNDEYMELDDAEVRVTFMTASGLDFNAVVENKWISSEDQDVAIIQAAIPPTYTYRQAKFACTKHNKLYQEIYYVGKGNRWAMPAAPGEISGVKDHKFTLAKLDSVIPGTSGAPIISRQGFEGMLLGSKKENANEYIDALSLAFIEKQLKVWKTPYDGKKLKKSTYLYGGLSLASLGAGIYFNGQKNSHYNTYKTHRDETAPIYDGTSRNDVYIDAKNYRRLEYVSYGLAAGFALTAYLVNNKCLFHKRSNKRKSQNFSLFSDPGEINQSGSMQASMGIKWKF